MENSWIWRNIVVADTDSQAESIATKAFTNMQAHISGSRNNLNTSDENKSIKQALDDPRNTLKHAVIYGSPSTVLKEISVSYRKGKTDGFNLKVDKIALSYNISDLLSNKFKIRSFDFEGGEVFFNLNKEFGVA